MTNWTNWTDFYTELRRLPCLGIAVFLVVSACQREAPQPTQLIRVIKTITVSERASDIPRKFPGVVEAVDTSALSFEVAGNVQEVRVDIGQPVKKGQVLARLDKRDFVSKVAAAEAELTRDRAMQTQKRKDFERVQNIFQEDPGATSQASLDEAQAAYESAQSAVNYALSKLDLARRDLGKTELVSPFDGVIADRSIDPFQEVPRGQTVFGLFAEGTMEIAISIPETVIDRVTLGLSSEIRFPTERDQVYKGEVSKVSSAAGTANAFPAKIAVLDGSQRILPGMTAEVTLLLPLGIAADTYLVPMQAVASGADAARSYVFVFDTATSTVKRTAVRVQGFRDNYIMVTEGLQTGDVVAVAGVSFLEDGQQVKLLEP